MELKFLIIYGIFLIIGEHLHGAMAIRTKRSYCDNCPFDSSDWISNWPQPSLPSTSGLFGKIANKFRLTAMDPPSFIPYPIKVFCAS